MTSVLDRFKHRLRDGIDLPRILPQSEVCQFLNGSFRRLDEAIHRRFADTMQTAVGTDFDKQPVLPARTYSVGFDIGNPEVGHRRYSSLLRDRLLIADGFHNRTVR